MGKPSKSKDEFIDKSVVDAKGELVGKCIDFVEENEPYLIIIVETNENEKKKSKVPLETVQAVGEMIVLNVEIEGVIKDNEIVALYNTDNNLDEGKESEVQDSDQKDTKGPNTTGEADKEEKKAEKDSWVLFKSIKS